jgi:ssDNA-binding Zn-finger/Zn-ribbon topoisomerase 1
MTAAALTCPECGAPMKLLRSTKYPKHPFFYGCSAFPVCRTTHGAHADGRPLGIPADRRTRGARIDAHAAFDPYWRARGWRREGAYHWLATQLGIERAQCHIGMMDAETCRRVVELCTEKPT